MYKSMSKSLFLCVIFVSLLHAPPIGWRPEVQLPWYSTVPHHDPHVTTSSGGIFVFLMNDAADPRCHEKFCDYSTDTGINWERVYIDVCGLSISDDYFSEDIIANGSIIHAVYEFADLPSRDDIRYRKSTDGGQTWGNKVWISNASGNSSHPAIALKNNDTIYVVFADWRHGNDTVDVYFSRSTDGGSHWRNPADTTQVDQRRTVAKYNSWHTNIAANNSYIHIVWADNRVQNNYEIYYNRSSNCGINWMHDGSGGNGYNLTNVAGDSEFPDIAIDGNSVYVVWQDDRPDSAGIWFRCSPNNGSSWPDSSKKRLYTSGGHPAVAADANGVYVVWEIGTHLYHRESTDGGNSWSSTQKITNSTDADSFPNITADSYGRHIVFQRSDDHIWYKQRDILKPTAPTNFHKDPWAVPPPVILYWNANSEVDLKLYRIYRKKEGNLFFMLIESTDDTTFTDNKFPQYGCYYYYFVTAVDLADNPSNSSDTIKVWVPDPAKMVSLGEPEASPYTIERNGYHNWGASIDSTADFGDCLKYRFSNLIPENEYTFGFQVFEPAFDSGRILSCKFKNHNVNEYITVPESLLYLCFSVPRSLYSNGVLDLTLNVVSGEAVLSQIVYWEHASDGPQSVQSWEAINELDLQFYPNPAKNRVRIEYNLPKRTDIELSIFDATGSLIKNIVGKNQASGRYRMFFDTTKLSQGVYFVRLHTSDKSIVEKVVVLR